MAGDSSWKGSIGVIIGSELAENQLQRLEGFRSVIDKTAGFQIVDVRSSNISRFQAAGQTEAMLSQYPGIRTIVGFSAWDAVGAVEGMKAKNRADIRVFGFDDLGETRQAIAGGGDYGFGRTAAERNRVFLCVSPASVFQWRFFAGQAIYGYGNSGCQPVEAGRGSPMNIRRMLFYFHSGACHFEQFHCFLHLSKRKDRSDEL